MAYTIDCMSPHGTMRWTRYGRASVRSAVLLLGITVSFGGQTQSQDVLPPPLAERDVIHERIDVHAQRSIVRLSKGSRDERFISRFLLRGVQYGTLGGIYIVNQKVPALRAKALGKGWWTLLQGRPALCWNEPQGERPLIILGTETVKQAPVLDAALVAAFRECGFRQVDVLVTKNAGGARLPCSEAFVSLASAATGVFVNPPCHTTALGVCHFAVPPAMYGFRVTCDGNPTSPPEIFRAVAPGADVQLEEFRF